MQLQLLAAATAINLKRLLNAGEAAAGDQTGDPTTGAATILTLIALLYHHPRRDRPPRGRR